MRRRISWTVGLAVAGIVAACQAPPSGELSPQDIAAIKATPGKFTKAQLAADYAGLGALFANGVEFFPANGAPIIGNDAALNFMKGFPKLTEFTAASVEAGGHGDYGYERGNYSFTTAAAPNAPSMTEKGTYLALYRKQADGSWKLTHDIWHSDSPAAPPPPAAKK